MKIQLLTNPHVFTHLLAFQQLRNRDVAALCFWFPRTWHFSLDTFCSFYCDGYQYETKPQAQGGRGYAELLFFPTAEGYVKTLYKDDLNEQEPADFQYIYIYKDHLGNNRLSYTLDPQTEQVKILEENHYYPFGLKHGSYNNTKKEVKYKEELAEKKEVKQVMADAVAFKYKYNGKELQDELGLNWYDYGARNYDAALGRWMSIDNLAEQYTAYSPYQYAGNNPILYFDVDGNEFTDAAWEWVLKVIKYMDGRLQYYDKRIARINKRLDNGKIDKKKANKRINELKAKKEALCTKFDEVRWEMATLATSNQVYDVVKGGHTETDVNGRVVSITDLTRMNLDNGRVEMVVASGTSVSLFGHELKHAYQFEIGEVSFLGWDDRKSYSFLKDKHDELAGYQRGDLLGGHSGITSTQDLPEMYQNLPTGPYNIHNFNSELSTAVEIGNHVQLQTFANYYNQAFRANGITYIPSKKSK